MTENFLPDFQPATTHGKEKTIQCLVRDKAIRVTPEERVRQRVLNWLIQKGWRKDKLRLEKSYTWASDPDRVRVRPDIELLGEDGKVLVVVECKREKVPLSECVDQQAIEYALKARAKWIWTTNGNSHGFLKETNKSEYRPVDGLGPLQQDFSAPRVAELEFPGDIDDREEIERYWESLKDPQFLDGDGDYNRRFVLAVHRVLFDRQKIEKEMPFSHGGVHILEDCGSAWHSFGNRSGGKYHTRYADFIAATRGRVEAVSVAVNRRRCRAGLRLCVGVRKPKRSHHALQLNTDLCERVDESKSWRIHHDGRMANIRKSDVFEAVIEAGAGQWITRTNGKDRVFLGDLPDADSANWKNSREFLANLVHYAIIRTNLREANSR